MTLLEALRLVRVPAPDSAPDPLRQKAIEIVYTEIQRQTAIHADADDRDDIAQDLIVRWLRHSLNRPLRASLRAATDDEARGFIGRSVINLQKDLYRKRRPSRRVELDAAVADPVSAEGRVGGERLQAEISEAEAQFNYEIVDAARRRMDSRAAASFEATLLQLRELRDGTATMEALSDAEAGDPPAEHGSPRWKKARGRLYRRMHRCRDALAREIINRRKSGQITKARADLLLGFLDQLQLRSSENQRERRRLSDESEKNV